MTWLPVKSPLISSASVFTIRPLYNRCTLTFIWCHMLLLNLIYESVPLRVSYLYSKDARVIYLGLY